MQYLIFHSLSTYITGNQNNRSTFILFLLFGFLIPVIIVRACYYFFLSQLMRQCIPALIHGLSSQ